MKYTDEQRDEIAASVKGQIIKKMYFEPSGSYWVIELESGGEMCVRFMSEIEAPGIS